MVQGVHVPASILVAMEHGVAGLAFDPRSPMLLVVHVLPAVFFVVVLV